MIQKNFFFCFQAMAVTFVNEKFPVHGITRISERIIMYRHDYNSSNILQVCIVYFTYNSCIYFVSFQGILVIDAHCFKHNAIILFPQNNRRRIHYLKETRFCDFDMFRLFDKKLQSVDNNWSWWCFITSLCGRKNIVVPLNIIWWQHKVTLWRYG